MSLKVRPDNLVFQGEICRLDHIFVNNHTKILYENCMNVDCAFDFPKSKKLWKIMPIGREYGKHRPYHMLIF